MTSYRLDKTHFKAQSFQEADNNREYWQSHSVEERLKAAWFLIAQAYGFPADDPPPMDKSAFSMRRHKHR